MIVIIVIYIILYYYTISMQIADMLADPEYKFLCSRRGKAVVIANANFQTNTETTPKTRNGACKDKDNLCKVFQKLGFEVDHHMDLTTTEMLRVLENGQFMMFVHYQDSKTQDSKVFI